MKARDVMTMTVVSVDPGTPVSAIAKTLSEHGISAVPVIDHSGTALGMVSEGDLIGRDDAAREARRDWWLTLLAEGEPYNPKFLEWLRTAERLARDVMAAPAVTVGEDTELGEVARLLTEHRIKRVPVVRAGEGRVVGIVSRADLVRAMASEHRQATQTAAGAGPHHNLLAEMAATRDRHFTQGTDAVQSGKPAAVQAEVPKLQTAGFRRLVADYERKELMSESHGTMKPAPVEILSAADIKRRMAEREAQRAAEELRRMQEQEEKQKAVMAEFHAPPDQSPEQLMQRVMQLVDQAAESGQTEIQVYRFPSELCTDRGRRINNSESDWEQTLEGRPKLGYEFWRDHLKPLGFGLKAEVLEYPGGMPGDIGFFLTWK